MTMCNISSQGAHLESPRWSAYSMSAERSPLGVSWEVLIIRELELKFEIGFNRVLGHVTKLLLKWMASTPVPLFT